MTTTGHSAESDRIADMDNAGTSMTEVFQKIQGLAHRVVQPSGKLILNLLDAPVIVLIYHRVTALPSDPQMLAVSPDNFRAQMQHLKKHFPIVRFEEDWTGLKKPAVAVTFDDGYADNALEALPILEELEVPATFFVSTGAIGTAREYWWHELERTILGGGRLPDQFTLEQDNHKRSWATRSEAERGEFYREMALLMTDAAPNDRDDLLSLIRDWAKVAAAATGSHRSMTLDELRLLAGSPVATIGAHTVTHNRLASMAAPEQREEITASKRQLESWLGREVTVFSYPFGRQCDYTRETVALCREAGFAKAASNFPGQAHRWTDAFQIPRHLVRDWPVDTFAQKLKRFWRS